MPDLYLHVGHHKTGSSFIQSALAASIPRLSDCEIQYSAPSDRDRAAAGEVSEGNGKLLLDHLEESGSEASAWNDAGASSLLFSREEFFFEFLSQTSRERLEAFVRASGFQSLRILLFTRNPVEHATSYYLEEVKSSGLTSSIEEYFETYDFPVRVERFLDAFSTATITVCNYSTAKDRLLRVVAAWLGVPPETLRAPPLRTVNRSMMRVELEFLRAMNAVLGVYSNFLSGPLSVQLADMPKEDLRPDVEIQEALCKRIEPVISRLNSRLCREGQYDKDVTPTAFRGSSSFSITREQIEILAQSVGHKIVGEQKLAAAAQARNEILRSKLEQRDGGIDERIRALRKGLEIDAENVPNLVMLARILSRSDPLNKEVQELIEKAAALNPNSKAVRNLQYRLKDRLTP